MTGKVPDFRQGDPRLQCPGEGSQAVRERGWCLMGQKRRVGVHTPRSHGLQVTGSNASVAAFLCTPEMAAGASLPWCWEAMWQSTQQPGS